MNRGLILLALLFLTPIFILGPAAAYQGDGVIESGEATDDELRKASQNPMADLISFPVQNNTNFDYGPLEKTQNVTNIQPVVPFNLAENWNLITRTIIPLIYQPEFAAGQGSKYGLGDVNLSMFFGPREPGKIIWGAGPVFSFPTASSRRLGTEKWGAGPAAVALKMESPWVFGVLGQNIWSFAGESDRDDVNQTLVQYFVNYNLPNGWYVNTAPIITANWEADSGDRWTVPFGAGVGRLIFLGELPLNMQAGAYYSVEKPDNIGPEWTLRVQVQTLLPNF